MNIKEIQLYTHNFSKQLNFYTQTLGFELLEKQDKFFRLKVGNSILQFAEDKNISQNLNYHFAFNIPENQIQEAAIWIVEKGLTLLPFQNKNILDFPNWNAEALYFFDENRNIVEFIARHDLNNQSKIPFSARSICEISEIGLPVDNVKEFYEQMTKVIDVPVYSHISNMTSFCAAGNAQGLFIIVPLQRNWLPTQVENGVFPIHIILEDEKQQDAKFQFGNYKIECV